MRTVHIEKKALSSEESIARLRAVLAARIGEWLVASDAAVATGLPLADAEQALLTLSTRHPCRVGVTDDGHVSVQFESLAPPAAEGTLARRWRALRGFLRRHRDSALALFTLAALPFIVLTGLTGAMAMGYATEQSTQLPEAVRMPLLFVGGLLALGWVAVTFVFLILGVLPLLAIALFISPVVATLRPFLAPWSVADPSFSVGSHLLSSAVALLIMWALGVVLAKVVLKGFKRLLGTEGAAWAPRLWRSIGGFVFGPATPEPDRLADERRLLERVAALDGVVTTPDLMALFGWSPAEAEREVMRVMLDYGGDVAVADDGTVLWIFDAFRSRTRTIDTLDEVHGDTVTLAPRPASPAPLAPAAPPPPLPRFFGCTRRFAALASFLIVPAFIGPAVHPALLAFPTPSEAFGWHGPSDPDPILQGFGAWPAALVLAIIALRVPLHLRRRAQAIVARRRHEIVAIACGTPHGAPLRTRQGDTRILAELAAELDPAAGAEVTVRFPWVVAAQRAAHAIRVGARGPG